MGVGRRLIQRRKQLRDDVVDNVPGREKIEKRDAIMNDSPGVHGLTRKYRRRQDRNFGKDSLDRKLEVAWEDNVGIARFDFDLTGSDDFGLKVTLSSSSEVLARGLQPGDELRISEQGSALEEQRFIVIEAVSEPGGDVAAGKARIVSNTEVRLPDDAGWADETNVQIRIEHGAGARLSDE